MSNISAPNISFIGLKFRKIHHRIIYSLCLKTEKRKQEKNLKETAAFYDRATEETKPRNGVVDINKERQKNKSVVRLNEKEPKLKKR